MRKIIALAAVLAAAPIVPIHAATLVYNADLSGAAESPPVASSATGWVRVTFDDVLLSMRVETAFQDLVGSTTVAHIHCCTAVAGSGTAGVATYPGTFPGFPLGVTAGAYDQTFDMTLESSYAAAFLTANGGTPPGAFAGLIAGLTAGHGYFNVHTNFAPGGEIRGFLARVPEPGSLALLGLGLLGLGMTRRKAA